jgi:N-acetylglucosamine-6-phosphate deacetylase
MFPANKLDSISKMCKNLVENWVGVMNKNSSVMMGLHAEGPIIASLGGLPPTKPASDLQRWTEKYLEDCGSALKVMTIAPSCEAKTDY